MKTIILTLSILSLLMVSGCGKVGQMGPPGPTGAQGTPGLNGQDAQPCTVTSVGVSALAPNGGSLITCPTTSTLVLNGTNGIDGIDGADGQNGQDGATGATGAAGAAGSNGTNGTVITMVKLCSGNTVYPSKFVEVAACINGALWGVYSANGGFLTELPAGTYGSNGINASCNFVIGANCTIAN